MKIEELISMDRIASRTAELGAEIAEFYRGKHVTAMVMMNGAMFFAADLLRQIDLPIQVDAIAASSYENNTSCGSLTFRAHPKLPFAGRHVLLIDDVLDTGLTIHCVKKYLLERGAASVRSCVLLVKDRHRQNAAEAEWKGFDIPDKYVVGVGLDSAELYRNLPFVGVLEAQ